MAAAVAAKPELQVAQAARPPAVKETTVATEETQEAPVELEVAAAVEVKVLSEQTVRSSPQAQEVTVTPAPTPVHQ